MPRMLPRAWGPTRGPGSQSYDLADDVPGLTTTIYREIVRSDYQTGQVKSLAQKAEDPMYKIFQTPHLCSR